MKSWACSQNWCAPFISIPTAIATNTMPIRRFIAKTPLLPGRLRNEQGMRMMTLVANHAMNGAASHWGQQGIRAINAENNSLITTLVYRAGPTFLMAEKKKGIARGRCRNGCKPVCYLLIAARKK